MKAKDLLLCSCCLFVLYYGCKKSDDNPNDPIQPESSCQIMKYESNEMGGYISNYSYSNNGNLLSIQSTTGSNNGSLYSYKYDTQNRILYEKNNNKDTCFFFYDINNQLISEIYKHKSGYQDTVLHEYSSSRKMVKTIYKQEYFHSIFIFEWGSDGNVSSEKEYNEKNELQRTKTFEYDNKANMYRAMKGPITGPLNINNIKTEYHNGNLYESHNYAQYNSNNFPTKYSVILSNGQTVDATITYECK